MSVIIHPKYSNYSPVLFPILHNTIRQVTGIVGSKLVHYLTTLGPFWGDHAPQGPHKCRSKAHSSTTIARKTAQGGPNESSYSQLHTELSYNDIARLEREILWSNGYPGPGNEALNPQEKMYFNHHSNTTHAEKSCQITSLKFLSTQKKHTRIAYGGYRRLWRGQRINIT